MTMLKELGRRPLILVVEDNPNDLRLLSNLIKDQGDIIFSTTGDNGLTLALQKSPDLIILGIDLPNNEGFKLCQRYKSVAELEHIPILLVTSKHTTPNEVSALESGAVDFLNKPFNPPTICARVKTHITLKRQTDYINKLAEKDGLTKVFNRRYFDHRAEEEWKRHQRQGHNLAFAIIGVDHLKNYNDLYGHSRGDICLKQIATTLELCTRRPGEFVSRYSGDEFICVLPNTHLKDAKKFGEYICGQITSLNIPHEQSDVAGYVTTSIGVSSVTPHQDILFENFLHHTDGMLNKAKTTGRNRVYGLAYAPRNECHDP